MVAKVAPSPEAMERLELQPGSTAFHDMPDGWRLYSETWKPDVEAKAVILFNHGWFESTLTLGVRRLAQACKTRGIIFVAYDVHGHGLSLEKNGQRRPESSRGVIDSLNVNSAHIIEMAKTLLTQYSLPLIVVGHSLSASGLVFATRDIIEACKARENQAAYFVYLAPTPNACSKPNLRPS